MATFDPGVATSDPSLRAKYTAERNKRLRADGVAQFVPLAQAPHLSHLARDPWVSDEKPTSNGASTNGISANGTSANGANVTSNGTNGTSTTSNGTTTNGTATNGASSTSTTNGTTPPSPLSPHPSPSTFSTKLLILGAGYSGLLFAAHLISSGSFPPSSILFADAAGGFGGTWYWNRYPGLMCDTEAYIYMPLLEETGYVPRHKYAYGDELREHAVRIARKWGVADRGVWGVRAREVRWDGGKGRWRVGMVREGGRRLGGRGRGGGERDVERADGERDGEQREEEEDEVVIDAQYVFVATGTLSTPQIPRVPGLDAFGGKCFHTSRWDYGVTGGGPSDWRLDKLRGKTVGIVGTGATAAQVVPELARWAEHLYVFQRTPSSVDERGQRATDPEEWNSKVAKAKGWQRARAENFNAFLTSTPGEGEEDLVADAWSRMPSYAAILGAPGNGGIVTPEKVPGHVAKMHEWDLSRAERVRARVDSIVADAATAEKLKAWYPVWCKRPVFHDEYLAAFNRANVTLVDTDGKGIDGLSRAGVVANGNEYPVDVLVLSTGFVSPAAGIGSPASRAGVKVYGREGLDMDAKWGRQGAATLHGVASNGFPNFFFPGPSQAGVTSNFTFALDRIGAHVAFILAEAEKCAQNPDKLIVEVTEEAEEAWSKEVMIRAGWFAAVRGCTPSYINAEGESDKAKDLAEQTKAARAAPWGEGVTRYLDVLRTWREEGGLTGYDLLERQPITSK